MNSNQRNGLAIAGLVAAILISVALLPEPQSGPIQSELVLTNVRVFDGFEVHDSATLVVRDGLVHSLQSGKAGDAGSNAIDATGKTLIPGLIDAHVHAYGPALSISPIFGVTSLLDMFRPPLDQGAMIEARQALSPTDRSDLFSAGYLATAEGGHGTQYGIQVPAINGPEHAEEWVAARVADGSDYIKIVIEDMGGSIPTLDDHTVSALIRAAHKQGLLAVAHVSTLGNARMAINAGADGLVHVFADEPADEEFIRLAREAEVFIVPTATVLASVLGYSGADWLSSESGFGERLSGFQRQTLFQRFPGSESRRARWPVVLASIQALHAGGVPILAGSDAPNPGTAFGASMHHELKLLVEAGMSPLDALKSATSTTASAFGLTGRGCLQVGCRADMVLIEGDPLTDISASTQIVGVWKNGHTVSAQSEAPMAVLEPAGNNDPVDLLDQADQWTSASDSYMGGQSTSTMMFMGRDDGSSDNDGQASDWLRVEGKLNPGFSFPYAGAMWSPGEQAMQAVNLSGMSRLRMSIDGNMTTYQVMFFSGVAEAPPTRLEVAASEDIVIELDDMPTIDLSQLRAIGVFASGENGSFWFRIDRATME